MTYEAKRINQKLSEEIKKEGYTLESFATLVSLSRQTLSNYLKSDMPLSKFLEICHELKLNPSSFFLENNGVIQNTSNSSHVTQTANSSMSNELELIKQENKYLKEQIELYKKLLESHQK